MISSQFAELLSRLGVFWSRSEEDMYSEYAPLSATVATTDDPVPWSAREDLASRSVSEGAVWGEDWQSGWFHIRGTVPQSWAGRVVVLRLNLGGECLVFDKDGCPECGLTCRSVYHEFFKKEIYRVSECARGGEVVDLWVEAAANNILGPQQFDWQPHPERAVNPAGHSVGAVRYLRLAVLDEELRKFRSEFFMLWYYVEFLKKDVGNYRCRQIAFALSDALDVYCGNPANAAAARAVLQPILRQRACDSAMSVTAVGHAHIDVGWLWPVRESIRKAARTYASQLRLIERFPEYVFGASQPQLYQFVKDNYPALYEQVKAAVRAWRWECQGGMWVEADDNIPSGESLIRQFLYGKNFFRDEFGVEVRNLWLPDVFGYNGNTPQIMQICGCDAFLTQKIHGNHTNPFPYNTFRWIGIDGSQVVAHFPPENTYNSMAMANGYATAQNRYQEGSICGEFVSLVGMGDGGGGPDEEMIERTRLLRDWEGSPRVHCGPAQAAFDKMIAVRDRLPAWHGELYYENSRGTLTSQARTKRNNRRLEQRLQLAEALFATLLPAAEYPRALLERCWKKLLINQFHDIIPGSSIRMVYETTEREHAEALEELAKACDTAGKRALATAPDSLTLFNSLSCEYARPVELPAQWIGDGALEGIPVQCESDGRLFALATVAPDSFRTIVRSPRKSAQSTVPSARLTLENALVRYDFDEAGRLLHAVLKSTGEEFLASPGNLLQLYHDSPTTFDAWYVEEWSRGEKTPSEIRLLEPAVCETGPVRSVIRLHFALGHSEFRQEIVLSANSAAVEFRTQVDWQEKHQWLKVAFPTAIHADKASYEIQYGTIQRSTTDNTSWEQAQFEVCAHRFADLSDCQRGCAILNDGKYGHRIKENLLELSLLRAPLWPDFEADRGPQHFVYAFLPHDKPLVESAVRDAAAQLNREPWLFPGRALPTESFVAPVLVEGDGVSLETLKRAEKSDDIILRIVETRGCHTTARLWLSPDIRKIAITDAIEWNEQVVCKQSADGSCEIPLKPFQILTVKVG